MFKKIISLALAILFISSVAYAVDYGKVIARGGGNQPSSGRLAGHGVGDIAGQGKYDSEPNRILRLVRYVPPEDSTVLGSGGHILDLIISKDSVVIWCTSVSGDDGVTVTLTDISQDSRIAGILASDALPPISTDIVTGATGTTGKRNYAWLTTYGPANAFQQGSGAAAGKVWGTSNVTGEIGMYTVSGCELNDWMASLVAPADASKYLGQGGFYYNSSSSGAGANIFVNCE